MMELYWISVIDEIKCLCYISASIGIAYFSIYSMILSTFMSDARSAERKTIKRYFKFNLLAIMFIIILILPSFIPSGESLKKIYDYKNEQSK